MANFASESEHIINDDYSGIRRGDDELLGEMMPCYMIYVSWKCILAVMLDYRWAFVASFSKKAALNLCFLLPYRISAMREVNKPLWLNFSN